MNQAKNIIFVFLTLTIVSSLLSAVTGNNLAFASSKKKDDSSGGSSSKDKGSGSGDSGGGGSSDKAGGGSSGSNDNGGDGGGSRDIGSTSTPPSTTEENTPPSPATTEHTCPDSSKPDPATGNCLQAATQQNVAPLQTLTPQQTCPDGSTLDANGNCPTPTNTPVQPQVKQVEVPANPDGSCPPGSFPVGSAGNAGQPGTGSSTCLSNTPPAGRPTDTPPVQPQAPKLLGNGVYELPTVPSEPTVTGIPSCPSGSHQIFGGAKCVVNGVNCPSGTVQIDPFHCGPPTPQTSNPPEFEIKPGITEDCHQDVQQAQAESGSSPAHTSPGNGQSPCTTPQRLAPIQTLAPQQTCKDGSTPDANGICQDGSTQTTRCPEGTLPTNIPSYCQPVGAPGPSQIEVPANPDGSCPEESYRVGSAGNAGQPGTGSEFCVKNVHVFVNVTKLLPGSSTADCTRDTIVFAGKCIPATPPMTTSTTSGVCPDGSTPDANGNCLTCPSNTQLFGGKCVGQLPVLPGSNTGTGGGFIQLGNTKPTVVYVPMNKDGTCPPGDEPASGGYCRHSIQSTPPAAPPTNTPPAQPQPSQPVCEPGFHWDTTQQECVPNGPK